MFISPSPAPFTQLNFARAHAVRCDSARRRSDDQRSTALGPRRPATKDAKALDATAASPPYHGRSRGGVRGVERRADTYIGHRSLRDDDATALPFDSVFAVAHSALAWHTTTLVVSPSTETCRYADGGAPFAMRRVRGAVVVVAAAAAAAAAVATAAAAMAVAAAAAHSAGGGATTVHGARGGQWRATAAAGRTRPARRHRRRRHWARGGRAALLRRRVPRRAPCRAPFQ